jgi:hypothetical protein
MWITGVIKQEQGLTIIGSVDTILDTTQEVFDLF